MHTLLSGMEMLTLMCMFGQLSPKGRFKPYYGEWPIIDESIPNKLEREYVRSCDEKIGLI
jgi:hypothetical protein